MKHKGAFPPSMDELLQDGMTKEEDFHSASDKSKRFIYLPGRQYQPTIVANNMEILAYDPVAVDKPTVGQAHAVLYTTGTIASLSKSALQLQLQKQGAPEIGAAPTTGPTTGPVVATMPVAAPPADALYDATVKASWPVPNWTDVTLPADSPWLKVCAVVKQVKFDKNTATVGMAFGPKAASKDDQAYKDFHKAVDEYFLANLKGKDFAHGKQTLGKLEYDRTTVEDGYSKHMLFMGIQDGRCVVFLYTGSPNCFPPFSANMVKAVAE